MFIIVNSFNDFPESHFVHAVYTANVNRGPKVCYQSFTQD